MSFLKTIRWFLIVFLSIDILIRSVRGVDPKFEMMYEAGLYITSKSYKYYRFLKPFNTNIVTSPFLMCLLLIGQYFRQTPEMQLKLRHLLRIPIDEDNLIPDLEVFMDSLYADLNLEIENVLYIDMNKSDRNKTYEDILESLRFRIMKSTDKKNDPDHKSLIYLDTGIQGEVGPYQTYSMLAMNYSWLSPFDSANTIQTNFHSHRREFKISFVTQYVSRESKHYVLFKEDCDLKSYILVMELEGNYKLLIILPIRANELNFVEQYVEYQEEKNDMNYLLTNAFTNLTPVSNIYIMLPKFIVKCQFDITMLLKTFTIRTGNDFKIAKDRSYYKKRYATNKDSDVKFKIYDTPNTNSPEPTKLCETNFIANHPFIYAIIHGPSQIPLIYGRFMEPTINC